MKSARDEEFTAYVHARRAHHYRTALMLCGDSHRAEDIVQEALAKLYAAWPRASRAGSLDAYVRRIVVNHHLDQVRRAWRRETSVPLGEDGLDVASRAGSTVEETDALMAALRRLPIGQRRVVVLRHYWGLSISEVAADLGVTEGTVKSQTHNALQALRRLLADSLVPTPSSAPDQHDDQEIP